MTNEIKQIKTDEPIEIRFLDPKKVRLFRNNGSDLMLTIEGECSYLKVLVKRSFPLSMPDHYFSFIDGNGKEIGVINDIHNLDSESKELVKDELRKRYFIPVIRKIKAIRERFGVVEWNVKTDKGSKKFLTRGLHDNILDLGPHRLMIKDVGDSRYEIHDITRLDTRSFSLLSKMI